MDRIGLKTMARDKVKPLVLALDRAGVSPDGVSLAGLGISVFAAWITAAGQLFLGALVLIVGSVFDMLDGDLARLQGRASRRGAFLDSNFDRLSEAAVYAGLAWFYMEALSWPDSGAVLLVILALTGSLTTSYARARAEGLGVACTGGWLQRPERMVLLILGMILGRHVLKLVLALLAAATLFTTLQRIAAVSRDLGGDPREGPPRAPRPPRADVTAATIVAVGPDEPAPARTARADEPVAERPDLDNPGPEGPDPEGEIPLVDPDDDDPYADLHRRG
ncbi:MAG: CDP-alcohol phosphatidyltransferase family protein [Candidatus Latescibacteria bacterium]|nr:CDP-alcohol phosphatidyltransferase family protein [Candidatus Latescibacterota bacterium]